MAQVTKQTMLVGVILAMTIFILAIIYPIGAAQLAQSYTCGVDNSSGTGNGVFDADNCSWGTSYNINTVMSTTELTIWQNVGVFSILVILGSLVGLLIKSMGFF